MPIHTDPDYKYDRTSLYHPPPLPSSTTQTILPSSSIPALSYPPATTLPSLPHDDQRRCLPNLKLLLDPFSNHPPANPRPPPALPPHQTHPLPHPLQGLLEAHVYNSLNAYQPPTSHIPQWTTIGVPSPSPRTPALSTDAAHMKRKVPPSSNLE